jgi:hypothetical protein
MAKKPATPPKPAPKVRGRPFKPGNPGGPGGYRPGAGAKSMTIKEARSQLHLHMVKGRPAAVFAWETLCDQMHDPRPNPVRIMACCKVLDRIFGKDAQSLNVEVRSAVDVRSLLVTAIDPAIVERFGAQPKGLPAGEAAQDAT